MTSQRGNYQCDDVAIVYLNDRFVEPGNCAVSLFDRGYLLGDGVFDTMRAYDGRIFALEEHVRRFQVAAEIADIPLEMWETTLADLLVESVSQSGLRDAYVRVTVSRGAAGAGIAASSAEAPTLSIIVRRLPHHYPAAAYAEGIETIILKLRRIPPCCTGATIKSTNYLPTILARRELIAAKMIEGIQLGVDGAAACGSVSNLFVVCEGCLLTPTLDSGALPGVTRHFVLQLARELSIPAAEVCISRGDLMRATEVFFTNTLMELLPVRSICGTGIAAAPGPFTRQLMQAYAARVGRHGSPASTRSEVSALELQ
ncbi:MAG TPA: aminotransferase class IV [Polyangiaceae bacterium]|nr:aminotransferase class IV [Polyangiaceae bacterium]